MTILVHEPSGSLILNASDPFAIREAIPDSKMLQHADYNVVVKYTLETTKVLRNLGYDAPAPIRHQYSWPGKYTPFSHQVVMAEFLTLHRKCFNLSEMGSAKTNSALWSADWLMQTGRVKKALIISPLSTLDRVWKQDIFDTLMHRTCVIAHGSREQRKKALSQDVDFYIINHDGICIPEIRDLINKRTDIDLIIVDEAGMFRNSSTTKYKALTQLVASPDRRLWLLTGTPCPNAPTDAWALAKLIDPARVPKYFGAFKRQTMMQIDARGFKWVPRADAFTTAYEAMQPAVRFKKSDCIDLPPVTVQDHSCALTKEQTKAYNQLRAAMVAEAKDRVITAVNAADQINKMRQILCGSIKDTATGDYISLPHGPRLDALLAAIEGASAKVIVVCPFRGILADLERELKVHYPVGVLHGDVSPKARDHIIRAFKQEKDPHVLLCHPKVMAHGLNLTEADMLIFYAPIYSNDEVQQVSERFNRAGQTRKMTIVRIGAHPLDWEIYRLADTKKAAQNSILDLYKQVTE